MVNSLFFIQILFFTKAQPSQNKPSRKDKSLNLLLCLRKCRVHSIGLLLQDT